MKIFNKTLTALAGLGAAFGMVASLSTPADTAGFSLIGGQLSVGQRDFRVYNNFTDAQANNNQIADPDFPSVLDYWQELEDNDARLSTALDKTDLMQRVAAVDMPVEGALRKGLERDRDDIRGESKRVERELAKTTAMQDALEYLSRFYGAQ